MLRMILISLFLSSCGYPYIEIEVDSDVRTFAEGITEEGWARVFTRIDLETDVAPYYIAYVRNIPDTQVGYDTKGLHSGNTILVEYMTENDWRSCQHLRYTAAHELLHHICASLGTCTAEQNESHQVPWVFTQWSMDRGLDSRRTVEHWIYMQTQYYCQDKWPSEGEDIK